MKFDAYYNYLHIIESELDDIKTIGNYTVYITSATSDNFKSGELILLEVRRVYFPSSKATGYAQHATVIYGAGVKNSILNRHFYLNKWSEWMSI